MIDKWDAMEPCQENDIYISIELDCQKHIDDMLVAVLLQRCNRIELTFIFLHRYYAPNNVLFLVRQDADKIIPRSEMHFWRSIDGSALDQWCSLQRFSPGHEVMTRSRFVQRSAALSKCFRVLFEVVDDGYKPSNRHDRCSLHVYFLEYEYVESLQRA